MATFGFEAVEQIHTFMVSGLQGLTTCSGIKWADINFNCNICGSHTRKKVSLVIDGLSENIKKTEAPTCILHLSWFRLEHVKTSRLPLYMGDQQTLYEKFSDTFIFRWLFKVLNAFKVNLPGAPAAWGSLKAKMHKISAKNARWVNLEIIFIITLFFTR